MQILQRINTSPSSNISKEREGDTRRKSVGRQSSLRRNKSQNREFQIDKQRENLSRSDHLKEQRGLMILAMKFKSVYFALIREAGSLPIAGSRANIPLLPNELSCLPLLSLEIKWIKIESKAQVTGLQQTDISMPFELYYFNQKLAFFEPAIEKVVLKASIDTDKDGNSEQRLIIENVLNINFSVALYESLFLLNENYQEERDQYKKRVSQAENEELLDQLREMGQAKPEQLLKSKHEEKKSEQIDHDFLIYSTSNFFIRNKTGEMLIFKAGRQPAFTEMQQNETLPLDFSVQPAQDTQANLYNEETGSKGLFDGIASSDMQPSSEFVSNQHSEETDDDEESDQQIIDETEQDEAQENLSANNISQLDDLGPQVCKEQKTRSMYRRGKFKLKRSEPNIVFLQVLIQEGKELQRTQSFEINFDLLSCSRVFLDENRYLYVICQIQHKDGQKILVVRSPMQVTNNLQIPIEIQLCIPANGQKNLRNAQPSRSLLTLPKKFLETSLDNGTGNKGESEIGSYWTPSAYDPIISLENICLHTHDKFMKGIGLQQMPELNLENSMKFSMIIKPESSLIIPLKACNFESVQIRPLTGDNNPSFQKDLQFQWSQEAQICLLQEESEIFETKPIILCSEFKNALLGKNSDVQDNETRKNKLERHKSLQQTEKDANNSHVFFALNANTYSIRSYIDFNTQKTEFISLRYLSITSPFIFQNLIPVPITMLFKDIKQNLVEQEKPADNVQVEHEKKLYELKLKHNSSLQVLFLNPDGNFEFSLAIPGYNHSCYVKFKISDEEDSELTNNLNNQGRHQWQEGNKMKKSELDSDSEIECNKHMSFLAKRAPFRFVNQRKLLFQLRSQFQNQFNICGNIAYIQGFYQISFYSKFWLLNNTQMPLQFKVSHSTFSFPPLDLPFESNEFDFETVKNFTNQGLNIKKKSFDDKPKRKDSGDLSVVMRESRTDVQEDTLSEYPMTEKDSVNYASMRKQLNNIIQNESGNNDIETLLRLKPWEAYKAQGRESDGLLAALTQQDIARVSSIYFTQELIKEESKEVEETYQNQKDTWPQLQSNRNLNTERVKNSNQNGELESQMFMTAIGDLTQRAAFSGVSTNPQNSIQKQQVSDNDTKKRTVQFQEGSIIIEGSLSHQSQSLGPSLKRNGQSQQKLIEDLMKFEKLERLTKTSKTSIQLQNFGNLLNFGCVKPLNQLMLSKVEFYEAPLQDKEQLKRIILFTDIPTEESLSESQIQKQLYQQPEMDQGTFLLGGGQQQSLKLKVCDSDWAAIPFDLARLHTGPIQITDSEHSQEFIRPKAMFELVAVVTYLPQPFSFSKLICFQPRYLMVNRTFQTIQVVQSNCEEFGTFKIFPQETSVFHWTDSTKQQQISVKMQSSEFSGCIDIDKIGEWNLRLKCTYGLQDNTILNVSISEETNSFYIVFTDVSYTPPYRLENLTKTSFNIAQAGCRQDDFDRLEPYSTRSFAWSYPLQKKELKISLCLLQSEEELGKFYIDSIQDRELIRIRDKEKKKEFIIEITSEKTMKVLRIMYPEMVTMEKEQDQENKGLLNNLNLKVTSQKLIIERLGISIVNSQARELSYSTISNLRLTHESTQKHQKLSLRVGDVQMDNQVSRQYDAIIFKRQERDKNHGDFFRVKFNLERNQTLENLIVFKYIIIAIVPFNIMIDGTFCDEMFLYGKDVFQLIHRYTLRKKQLQLSNSSVVDHQNALLNAENGMGSSRQTILKHGGYQNEMKGGMELSKKGQPYAEHRDMQKIYIENFLIGEINMSMTFSSRPVVFREFAMHPLLKFLITMLSNMSHVQLSFNKYHVQHEHMLVSIFMARLNQFYRNEFINHKQLLNLFSQMGLFGQIYGTISTLWTTFKSIIFSPLQAQPDDEGIVKAVFLDSIVFLKDQLQQLSGSIFSSIANLKTGVAFIAYHYGGNQKDAIVQGDLFEDDLEHIQRNYFSSPLLAIDTQNQLWLKVITREIQSTDGKKRKLRKQKNQDIAPDDQEKRKSNRRVLDVRTHTVQNEMNLKSMATTAARKVINLPSKIKQAYSGVVTTLIQGDTQVNGQLQKVRPPRFVGFTMELEPYSKKKAFVLQILNDINLNVQEAETIHKMYNLNNHTVIITGKRIICVDEQRLISKDPQTGTSLFAQVGQKKGNVQNVFSGSIVYKHWNIFFKDIYRVSLDIVDRETGKIISKAELERALMEQNHDDESQSQDRRDHLFERKIQFVLRLHYQMEVDEEGLMFDDGTVSASSLRKKDNPQIMQGLSGGFSGLQQSLFGEKKKKKNYELLNKQKEKCKDGLLDGLSGLMVGRKDITAKVKDFRVIKHISKNLDNKLSKDKIKNFQRVHELVSTDSQI